MIPLRQSSGMVFLIHIVWIKKAIPDDWRRGIILPLWKNKGGMPKPSRHNPTLHPRKAVCNDPFLSASDQPSTTTAALNKLVSLLDEVQPNTFSQFVKSSKNRRNLIGLPTLLLSTSKLPLTQCPGTPCGKFFKSMAFHRNFLFLCVNCTQTPAARCVSLLLCQKSSPSRLA